MNDLEKKIQAALRRESSDSALVGEPNLAEEVLAAFRGRHRWVTAVAMAAQLAALAGFVYAATRFLGVPELAAQLRWGGLALLLFGVSSMIKIWFWLELHSNRVLREVKRVELLLVTRSSQ